MPNKIKHFVPADYDTLREIICPYDSWIDHVPEDQGRDEINAILDILIEFAKLMKSKAKQIKEAHKLKKVMNNCKIVAVMNKAEPKMRLQSLEKIWDKILLEADALGFCPEYDPETDRMILSKKELIDLECPSEWETSG